MEQQCSKCNEIKKLEDFHKRKSGRHAQCKVCRKSYNKKRYENNTDKIKEMSQEYRRNNKEQKSKKSKETYIKNKEAIKKQVKKYKIDNKGKIRKHTAKRRAIKKQASVSWGNQKIISNIYEEAINLEQQTGIKHHVDHIIPLQGKTVCGLHVEKNLQILTAKENLAKHNKFEE
jgi:hypothetical protein